ncbi:hypothetical protein [Pseudovibrio sp. Alg231-02]|uniref:hypothetical protein n=1 Tax=Pseudovibrio sp. Alg231-02 TaxID=1922223 RepID=UPI000D54D669|nr:hypothetical protein [Pseudovibrio sp. Alg231-02]
MKKHEEFAAEARLYFACANDADKNVGKFPAYAMSAPRPVMLLMAFSIELSLKSFLLENGCSYKKVKKLGHNLARLWDECNAYGADKMLVLNEKEIQLLAVISDLHRNMSLRYRVPSKLGRLPVYGALEVLAHKFLVLCKAPSLKIIHETGF